jgi:uncharacterized protein (DUF1697 family)
LRIDCTQVRTYIQSGNAVFKSLEIDSKKLVRRIERTVVASFGFKPRLFLIAEKDLEKAAASNPFPKAQAYPSTLHLLFLAQRPSAPDLDSLSKTKTESEKFCIRGQVFYLYAPNGIGRSKLAAGLERFLGVEATGRNWNTVTKMIELAGQVRNKNSNGHD